MVGIGHIDSINWINVDPKYNGNLPLFADKFVALGILSSIPAIFFAFDGFYSTAGIQTEMKEPRKVSMAMGLGIAIVSAIDIVISFSLLLGTKDGKMAGLKIPFYVIQIMEMLVAIGILGIINGVAIYGSRYYEDLIRNNEIPFASRLRKYSNNKRPVVGTLVSYAIMIFRFAVFTLLGLFFINLGHYHFISGY
jgi:amino acid transporter